tara:strand:- start:1729 stop:1971 length:243 start_codon:yes stop_codon:yes gene_type:complete
MIKKKNKPTLKELIKVLGMVSIQLEQLQQHVFKGDQALDEYMKMQGTKDKFIKYLEDNFKEKNDQDKQEAEDKQLSAEDV